MLESKAFSEDVVEVNGLTTAAWLRLNGEFLIDRRMDADGLIVYVFRRSDRVESLINQWASKSEEQRALMSFSRIVSFEIRKAIGMRRSLGLPPRLGAAEKQ